MIKPKTRKEKLLAAIANDAPVTIQPKNREELFLAQIAEKTGNVPKPLTQEWLPKGYPWDGRTVIEWDGNTEGLESASVSGLTLYKVSDKAPLKDEVIGGTLSVPEAGVNSTITEEYIAEDEGCYFVAEGIFIVYASGLPVSQGAYAIDGFEAFSITYGTATPISETLLPESVKRVVVNVTFAEDGSMVADRAFADIRNFVTAGADVIANLQLYEGAVQYLRLLGANADTVTFSAVNVADFESNGNFSAVVIQIVINADNSVVLSQAICASNI